MKFNVCELYHTDFFKKLKPDINLNFLKTDMEGLIFIYKSTNPQWCLVGSGIKIQVFEYKNIFPWMKK